MVLSLLKEESNNEILDKDGFVVIPFLDTPEICRLIEIYRGIVYPKDHKGFHATMFHEDKNLKENIDNQIKSVFSKAFQNKFSKSYKVLYTNFMVKEPGTESAMKWHQDWTYVDESMYKSFAIWIPLLDLNEKNGAFTVAPKSHKMNNHVRGPGVEDSFINESWVKDHYSVKPLYLKAGEAVIWNHRLLHSSPANITETPRIAATAIIVPASCETIHYYRYKNEKFLRLYKTDTSFYTQNDIRNLPHAPLIKRVFYSYNPLSNRQQIKDFSLLNKMKSIFS